MDYIVRVFFENFSQGGKNEKSVHFGNGDDIFTVNGVDSYTGCEIPTLKNDIFLAP